MHTKENWVALTKDISGLVNCGQSLTGTALCGVRILHIVFPTSQTLLFQTESMSSDDEHQGSPSAAVCPSFDSHDPTPLGDAIHVNDIQNHLKQEEPALNVSIFTRSLFNTTTDELFGSDDAVSLEIERDFDAAVFNYASALIETCRARSESVSLASETSETLGGDCMEKRGAETSNSAQTGEALGRGSLGLEGDGEEQGSVTMANPLEQSPAVKSEPQREPEEHGHVDIAPSNLIGEDRAESEDVVMEERSAKAEPLAAPATTPKRGTKRKKSDSVKSEPGPIRKTSRQTESSSRSNADRMIQDSKARQQFIDSLKKVKKEHQLVKTPVATFGRTPKGKSRAATSPRVACVSEHRGTRKGKERAHDNAPETAAADGLESGSSILSKVKVEQRIDVREETIGPRQSVCSGSIVI